ncbi:ribosome silencing factor [Salisaeta longa]|uniref:ribosome silencing factor n=1 Tax=Salisaeta longa TaxID=503170 RepID=UPI0003B7B68A|nr:ribosome silencing factor [Salisaeta longa]
MASSSSTSSASSSPAKQRVPRNAGYELAAYAVDAMADKKATDIVVLDLRSISSMADFFVIGTGHSDLQVRAIANGVMDDIEEICDETPWHKEGLDHRQWVLLDYVDLVVHVFSAERREHYNIERLWGEATAEEVPTDGDAADVALLQQLLRGDTPPEDA